MGQSYQLISKLGAPYLQSWQAILLRAPQPHPTPSMFRCITFWRMMCLSYNPHFCWFNWWKKPFIAALCPHVRWIPIASCRPPFFLFPNLVWFLPIFATSNILKPYFGQPDFPRPGLTPCICSTGSSRFSRIWWPSTPASPQWPISPGTKRCNCCGSWKQRCKERWGLGLGLLVDMADVG